MKKIIIKKKFRKSFSKDKKLYKRCYQHLKVEFINLVYDKIVETIFINTFNEIKENIETLRIILSTLKKCKTKDPLDLEEYFNDLKKQLASTYLLDESKII